MNGYERYMQTVKHASVDHLARVPILMQYAAEHIGSNYGAFASDYQVLVEANLRAAEDFGLDQVSAISDAYRETQGFGGEIEFVKDGVPRCLKPPLAETKDFSVLAKPDPYTSERMLDRIKAVQAYQEKVAGEYSILGWVEGPAAEAADLRGVTAFMMDLFDDETFAGELMDRCVEVGIAFARAQLKEGADTIGIGDAVASQLSPELYEEHVLPREKRLVDTVREAGGLVKLHICGNITHILDGIATLGVDVCDCDWQVDLTQARKILGNKVTLTGNLDPVEAVMRSTPDAIRKAVKEAYASAGDPYMVNAGCEIPSGTPPENLKALCAEVACSPR